MSFGNMQKMMKQVQKMQADMARLQEELAGRTVEASSGGGAVTIVANGKQEVVSIKIKQEAVDPDDVEMLEDMLLAAVNEAIRKSQEMVSGEMSKITGGMKIPGLF
ncbi:YbaB/EbfC family nucleoid-associated protein [Candidatus Formimonas warabiya]|uniref:Nucleoid-associated protein DCMF_18220 n=1 Tax=Formimonas warabiya TaxID=1761012 RepID=A0A3G1KVM2_FORW1|nr:YbaB/EbfC family nucleoid-associated protein [Candidatus Formimonas warabiya]ATW26429.1 YbaB/EbfC family nucleoid-associated protein [Candidatus Formimonas warabiya]